MCNIRKFASGQNGAKKLQMQYGDDQLCVRYRYDQQLRNPDKTIELSVEEAAWTLLPHPVVASPLACVRVEFKS